jgi:hypothetical protein
VLVRVVQGLKISDPSICSDSCALSLQPFRNPVAVIAETPEGEPPRADVFDLLNIVPYVRKFKTSGSSP